MPIVDPTLVEALSKMKTTKLGSKNEALRLRGSVSFESAAGP